MIRKLEDVLETLASISPHAPSATLSSEQTELLTSLLGEPGLALMQFLDGREQCADVFWNLDTVSGFAHTMFADVLGAEAGLTILAFSGSGDAWAIDWNDAKMVFLNHDGMEQTSEYPMVVPLGMTLEELVRIADAWAALEEKVEEEEVAEDILISDFLRRLEVFSPRAAASWPYS